MTIIRTAFTKLSPDQHFSASNAQKHGLIESLIISNIARRLSDSDSYYIKEYEGKMYVRSSSVDIAADMPYLTVHQVRRAVNKLIKTGALLRTQIGRMDRSLWITLGEI